MLRRVGSALAWTGLVVIISVAGAGLVIALDHAQTDTGRPELTAAAHAAIVPRLASLDVGLVQLTGRTDAVSTAGRLVLGELRTLNAEAAAAALAAGTAQVVPLQVALDSVRAGRSDLLTGVDPDRLPSADLDRVTAIDAAIEATADVPSAWAQIEVAGGPPIDLLRALSEHDRLVFQATAAGREEQWPDALVRLEAAATALRGATAVRNDASERGLDVATLDDWLDRAADYDAALVSLYEALRDSGGVRTAGVEALLVLVDVTQDALPADQDGLVVVMSDLATAEVTRALLRIEDARAAIEATAGALD